MTVRYTNRRERIRRADGTRVDVPGGDPMTGRAAIAAVSAGARPISGAARAAVRSHTIEPHVEARIAWDTSARFDPWVQATTAPSVQMSYGQGLQVTPGSDPFGRVSSGDRLNPEWAVIILGVSRLGEGGQLAPPTNGRTPSQGRPLILTPDAAFAGSAIARVVPNPEADAAGAAWAAVNGTYSRASSPTLPGLGLPGTNAHRVVGSVSAGPQLVAPWQACRYRVGSGRIFTVAAWVTSSHRGTPVRLRLDLEGYYDGTNVLPITLTGPTVVVDGPTRVVATMVVPASARTAGGPAVFSEALWSRGVATPLVRARAAVEVVPTTGDTRTVTVDVRGAHAYAGTDRGDVEGLKAAAVLPGGDAITQRRPYEFTATFMNGASMLFDRVDVHGVDRAPAPTSVSAYTTTGSVGGWSASPGRQTVRLSAAMSGSVVVAIEECAGATTQLVGVSSIELVREGDLTARVIELGIDRASDADPADSTTPIGNYAATTATLVLDNVDGGLSPFRSDDPDLGRRLEPVVGVVYTNRHADPFGENLDPRPAGAPWEPANALTNGTFEVDTTTWQAVGATTLTRVTTPVASGAGALRVVTPATTATGTLVQLAGVLRTTTAGQVVSIRARVLAPAGQAMTLNAQEYTSGSALVGTTSTSFVGTGAYQDVYVERVPTGTGNKVRPMVVTATATAVTFYVDDVVDGYGTTAPPPTPVGAAVFDGPAWAGPALVPVTPDVDGQVPPGAVRMMSTDTIPGGPIAAGVVGQRYDVTVWARATGAAAGRLFTPGPGPDVVVPAGTGWRPYTMRTTLTVDTGSTVRVIGSGVHIAAPTVELLDTATDDVVEVIEAAPAGVFWVTDWPTATDDPTVTVTAIDVLGQRGGEDMRQDLPRGMSVGDNLRLVYRRYLDLGEDQVVIASGTPTVAYTIPAATVGQQIADLAKAGVLSAFTDGAGRATSILRAVTEPAIVAEYRHDNALIRGAVPFTPSLVRNDVEVITHPTSLTAPGYEVGTLANATPTDVTAAGWTRTGQELAVPPATRNLDASINYGMLEVLVPWDSSVAAVLSGAIVTVRAYASQDAGVGNATNYADKVGPFTAPNGSSISNIPEPWLVCTLTVYPTFGVVTFRNLGMMLGGSFYSPTVIVDHVRITGVGVQVGEVRQRFTQAESVRKYGRRPVTVDVRLADRPSLGASVATDVLANYSLVDPSGERWLPDLEVETLGDPWRELGDRVLAAEPVSGLGGEFLVVSHRFTIGAAMSSSLYLRRTPTGRTYFVLGVSTLDGPSVLSY